MNIKKIFKTGYTLLEVTIVVGIILLMLTLTVNMLSYSKKLSRDVKRKTDVEQIKSALEFYRKNNDFNYPVSLNILVENEFIKELPKDPLNKDYYYTRTGLNNNNFIIASRLELGGPSQCGACSGQACNYCSSSYGIMLTPTPIEMLPITITQPPTPTPTIVHEIYCWQTQSAKINETVTLRANMVVSWEITGLNCNPKTGSTTIFTTICTQSGTGLAKIYSPDDINNCLIKVDPL